MDYFTPETKEQSKQWTSPGEPAPKKAKTVKSAGKVMATVFWDARGIIHIEYLPLKQMINDDYYAALLDRFNNILKKKRSQTIHLELLFLLLIVLCTIFFYTMSFMVAFQRYQVKKQFLFDQQIK